MSPSTITILFLLFAIVMFVLEKIPLGVTSMIVCVGLIVTGVLDAKTAFADFIDSNVILFVAMFIVGGAFFETGMANKIGGIVTKFAKSERMLIAAVMIIVGMMSGVLSNTGTAAVLIPVVIGIAAKSGYSRSKLLMPLVFAAAMGGNLSLIGAPGNMIAQSALSEIGLSFGFFEYAIVGFPILICGTLFYTTLGMKLLPDRQPKDDGAETASICSMIRGKISFFRSSPVKRVPTVFAFPAVFSFFIIIFQALLSFCSPGHQTGALCYSGSNVHNYIPLKTLHWLPRQS